MTLPGALAALLLAGPAHGYALHAALEAELGPAWTSRASHLYLTLGRMQRDGLVTTSRVRQDNRPDRQLLELTDAGRRAAEEWLGSDADTVVRLAVARLVVPGRFEELAARAVQRRSEDLARLRARRGECRDGFQAEALEAEIMRAQADVRWAAQVRDRAAELIARPRATPKRGGSAVAETA